jgi:hypothetical protein
MTRLRKMMLEELQRDKTATLGRARRSRTTLSNRDRVDGNQPYVTGIVATGPGTIVVTYLSGTVTAGPTINTAPFRKPSVSQAELYKTWMP